MWRVIIRGNLKDKLDQTEYNWAIIKTADVTNILRFFLFISLLYAVQRVILPGLHLLQES